MKMRTDVLWEPDKTDEHDRLLSRFEDDIIGRAHGRSAHARWPSIRDFMYR